MKTFKNTLLAFALSFGAAACGGTDPDPTPGSIPTQTGPSPSAQAKKSAADVAPFLGVWWYASGSITIACDDGVETSPVTVANGTLQILAGAEPNKISVIDSGCTYSATVTAGAATPAPGTVCPGDLDSATIALSVSDGILYKQAISTVSAARSVGPCTRSESSTLFHQ